MVRSRGGSSKVPKKEGKTRRQQPVVVDKAVAVAIKTEQVAQSLASEAGGSSFGPHQASTLSAQDVVNLMAQAQARKELARTCSPDETPEDPPEGWFCMHEHYITKCHLRFPLPDLLLDLLDHFKLALPQLCPSVIRVVLGSITRARETGFVFGMRELLSLFLMKESPLTKGAGGTYYLPARPGRVVFNFSISDENWRKKFFFVKIDPSTVPVNRTLRSTWGRMDGPSEFDQLSPKAARYLVAKLKEGTGKWLDFPPLRINKARFPDLYQVQFPTAVGASYLEESSEEAPIEVSTDASTSQTVSKMPLQKSFRNKPKQNATTGSSRTHGSSGDKVPAGSFRQSIKDVLDDGSSQLPLPVVPLSSVKESVEVAEKPREESESASFEAKGNEIIVASAETLKRRAPSPPRSRDGQKPEHSPKRHRSESNERSSRPHSSRSSQGSWSFTHSGPKSVLDNDWEVATLMRHLKQIGVAFPAISQLSNSDGYLDVAHCFGQLANALNKAFLGYENQIKGFPDARELQDVKDAFQEAKEQLDQSRLTSQKLQTQVDELKSQLLASRDKVKDLRLDLDVKAKKISSLESSKKTLDAQVQDLLTTNQEMTKNKTAEVRLAVRRGKKEMMAAYDKVLSMVKEKFEKKKEEISLQIPVQEIQANLELLEDLIAQEISSVQEEHDKLAALLPEAKEKYDKAQVSDFTVSKLPLPQISETSDADVTPIAIAVTQPRSGEHGSQVGLSDVGDAPEQVSKEVGDKMDEA